MYIYQNKEWPIFTWNEKEVNNSLIKVVSIQNQLIGKLSLLGFEAKEKAALENGVLDVMNSNEIEGEFFLESQVRSSIAKNLGIDLPQEPKIKSEEAEGAVNIFLDATRNYKKEITEERLFDWHAGLFPTGRSKGVKIEVAGWRKSKEPMQIVSGPMGKEKIHYEAPKSEVVPTMMEPFIEYVNENIHHPFIKAAVTHLWFEIIHPFDDGNGRIGRALVDKILCEADNSEFRYYSFSNAILQNKKEYYSQLNQASKSGLDITKWIIWFFEMLLQAIKNSEKILIDVDFKRLFWNKYAEVQLNNRQLKVIKKLLEGFVHTHNHSHLPSLVRRSSSFEGNITSSKWTRMTKCTKMTATRDINDLIEKGILLKNNSGGRSTSYILNLEL